MRFQLVGGMSQQRVVVIMNSSSLKVWPLGDSIINKKHGVMVLLSKIKKYVPLIFLTYATNGPLMHSIFGLLGSR